MTEKSEYQKKKVERLAAERGITPAEYKRQCDQNTAKNKGMTLGEYRKERLDIAAQKRNMTAAEYRRETAERVAKNRGFRNKKDYDLACKRARARGELLEQYCSSLEKDSEGYYILPKNNYTYKESSLQQ